MKPIRELNKLRDLNKQLLSLSEAALGLVKLKEFEALEDIWPKRARLIRSLEQVNRRLNPFWGKWSEGLASLSVAEDQKAREIVDQVRKMCQSVLNLDRQMNQMLLSFRDEEAKQLNRVNQAKKLFNAYHPRDPVLSAPDQISKLR
ncbi:hypothetical protein [Dethiosulfatarculus sandiegensis]|uniref:FlgN family protein n=1 Tax=Dethiosulfatarculus sandiegensis TaxID=1429043 RepID=A0A0D2HSR8_9BACT|nr:hypothetical protein [Dethiosulfatarculus sandiegensis]KIX13558.1 hypothetical protein X474_13815 [Dethiosulfatarculus sandiegensis]